MKIKNKKRVRKVVSIVVLTMMIMSALLPLIQVFADDTVPEQGSTNAKTTNMLSLFREDSQDVDSGKISEEEYRVYGVFLSNFFIPGQTTVKDLKGTNTDLSDKVSQAFTGDKGISSQVSQLNDKLYEGISHASDGLGSATEYVLYNKDKKPMTGLEFLNAIGSGGSVYSKDKEIINFKNDKAMKGALQILMGVAPDLFIGYNKTLFKKGETSGIGVMDMLYMDGVGNIWGSYKPESGTLAVDDYILIMPGCLNPLTFNRNKVPVTNAFAMGAMLDLSSMNIGKDTENILRPYYNIGSLMSSNKDSKNMLNIYGIHAPTKYVGNTNSIINGANKLSSKDLIDSVKKFVDSSVEDTYTSGELKIIISLDLTKTENFKKNLDKIIDSKNIKGFAEYFGHNLVFGVNEIADEMYFFTDSANASGNAGDFKTGLEKITEPYKMFVYKENGKYRFYTNGIQSSRFSTFLKEYYGKGTESAKKEFLKETLGEAQSNNIDSVYTFLEVGRFSSKSVSDFNTLSKTNATLTDVLKVSNAFTSNVKLFSLVDSAKTTTTYDKGWFRFDGGVVKGMAHLDTALMSATLGKGNPNGGKAFGSSNSISNLDNHASLSSSVSSATQECLATLFHTVNTYNIFSIDSSISSALTGGLEANKDIETPWGTYKTGTYIANGVNNWPGIYWGYTVSLLGTKIVEGNIQPTGWTNTYLPDLRINTTGTLDDFASSLTGGVTPSSDKTLEEMQKDIIQKIYGLLSEDDNSYRANLIDTTLDGFILNTHRAIVGSWVGDNFTVGTGKTYTSAVGYLSTPSIKDLSLTSWLLDDYGTIYMFSLLLILMVIVIMVVTNSRTTHEGLALFLIMGFVLMIPQALVVNIVDITNSITDKIYSNKFNYWAISQHHEYIENGLKAGSSAESNILYTMEMNKDFSSSDARVRIKWMSPKKEEEFDKLYSNESKLDGIQNNLVLAKFLMSNFMNQTEYVVGSDESYLYRPYSDIANSAKSMYVSMSGNSEDISTLKDNIKKGKELIEGVPSYRFDGLFGNIVPTLNEDLLEKIDTYSVDSNVDTKYRYWGLGNFGVTSSIFRDTYTIEEAGLTSYEDDDEYSAFLLMTESPYYYFYNVLKSRYGSVNGGFKNALLEKNVFKVTGTETDADGELRDFLDMEGLFTVVVPYLKQSNEYVNRWTRIYGETIDSFDFNSGEAGEAYQDEFDKAKIKKEALKKVWKMYSPWVDGIYESAGGRERTKGFVIIDDQLNPGAYAVASNNRRMCFSSAEKEVMGLNDYTLTDAELRIQKVQKGTYEDLMYLINYYDFNDEVLLSMAAMMATFNFNKEFSEYRLLGNSTVIYPQNFELKNFNFDAYMRLMIVNATGEPMKSDNGDLYERMLSKTSVFTGVLLLIVDVLGVMIIPAVKLLALVLIFLLSIVIGFSCILVPTDKIFKRIMDSLIKPLLMLMVALVSFSFVMSLFMGEGYTSYVGSKTPSMGITDPNILMLLIVFASGIYLYVLLKIVAIVWKYLKTNGVATALGFVATAVSLGSTVANMANNATRKTVRGGTQVARGLGETAKVGGKVARGGAKLTGLGAKGLGKAWDGLNGAAHSALDLADGSYAENKHNRGKGSGFEDSNNFDSSNDLIKDIEQKSKTRVSSSESGSDLEDLRGTSSTQSNDTKSSRGRKSIKEEVLEKRSNGASAQRVGEGVDSAKRTVKKATIKGVNAVGEKVRPTATRVVDTKHALGRTVNLAKNNLGKKDK